MRVLSLFSGAGGMDLGLETAGHEIVAMCEIDPKCRELLAHRWPNIELHEDVTTLDGSLFRGRVDIVSGGSPCQDLSVAGRRAGLDGARSGLFWHQCRIADQSAARWVLWENVAGALSSSNGEDFAAVLWGLTGTYPRVPDGGWRAGGMVVGPKRWAVWRLLDARWFGVAQRRRRVFVVAGAGGEPAPEILFESESCPRGVAPSVASREDVAGTLGGGTPGGGPRPDTDRMTFIPTTAATFVKTTRPRSEHDPEIWTEETTAPTLNQFDNGHETRATILAAQIFSENQRGETVLTDYSHALPTGGGKPGSGYPAVVTPVAFKYHSSGQSGFDVREDHTGTLTVASGLGIPTPTAVQTATAVRRLTPLECERLMGWNDFWTAEGINGPISDSHRYRMCGNGVVSNVTEWIGRRLP